MLDAVLSHRLTGPVMVLVAATGFAFKAILIKLIYADYAIDAETLLALRLLISLPFFALIAATAGGGRPPDARDWRALIGLGFIGYYLASYLDFLGLQYIPAGLERLILYLQPTIVVLLSAFWFRTPVRRHHIAAIGLSYAGIALVFATNLEIAQDARSVVLGSGLVFLCAFFYGWYMLGSGTVIPRIGAARFTGLASMAACVFATAHFLLTHDASALLQPARVYWLTLVMALVSTVLPIWLMSEGIRRIGANQVALISSIGPVITIYFGWELLGEPVTAVQLAGAALVLGGVLLVSLKVEPVAAKS